MHPPTGPSTVDQGERVLSTLNRDGTRRWLRPRLSTGAWLNRRRIVGYSLIALFAGLPYIRIGGKPGVFLDLATREFTFLGRTLYATDTVVLAPALLSVFVGIFLLTALFGRVWCGWACPQTVYMELVYRPIERLFEGRNYRTGGRSGTSGARMLGKYAAFLVVSLFLSHVFLSYFVGTEALWRWMHHSPFQQPAAFLLVFSVTALMMFDFAYMREQVCTLMCPYGRLQSALLDDSSLIVAYDTGRGEPRGKLQKGEEGRGDCIDCFKCVATCPTGIDIRDGLQMECIHCTQCIDACDDVMTKIRKPTGLIRYGSQNQIAGIKSTRIRARVVVYPLILAITLSLFGLALKHQSRFDATILRTRNTTFSINDAGGIDNVVQVKIQNRDTVPRSYAIEVVGVGELTSSDLPLIVPPQATGSTSLHVSMPPTSFDRGRAALILRITEEDGAEVELKGVVLGPLFTPSKESN